MVRYTLSTTFIAILATLTGTISQKALAQENENDLTINQAIELMLYNNSIIQQAQKGVEIAQAEKQKLNSTWYPLITAGGTYMHFSNDIEAKESVKELLEPFKEALPEMEAIAQQLGPAISQLFPGADIAGIASKLAGVTFSFPLLDKNVATIDGSVVWTLFAGGKRVYANRIGKSLVMSSVQIQDAVEQSQTMLLIERYYMCKLAKKIVGVQQQNFSSMQKFYNNAKKMMDAGMINKAEMLVAKVACQEAERELESALNNDTTTTQALIAMLYSNSEKETMGDTYYNMECSSPFFICSAIPSKEQFKMLVDENNPQLQLVGHQKEIVQNRFKIARSGYMPDIALFGKQNIYSHNIPRNLSPRSVVGAGFVWNIFDGLHREKSMQATKKEEEMLDLSYEELQKELHLLSDKLYSQLSDAKNNLQTINASIELAGELVKIQQKSFNEGMATSLDVINAHTTFAKTNIAAAMAYFQYDIALSALLAISGNSGKFLEYMENAQMVLE